MTTPSSSLAANTQSVKAKAEKASASKPAYEAEDEAIRRVSAEADEAAAKAKTFDDLASEIRRTADEVGVGKNAKPVNPQDVPPGEPGERLANLREKLNKDYSKAGPDQFLKPKADAVQGRLAGIDPEAELRTLDAEAAGVEAQAAELKAAVESRPVALQEKLRLVGQLEGRANELAAIEQRIERLRSDSGGTVRQGDRGVEGGSREHRRRAGTRVNDITPRRVRASALSARAAEIDHLQAILPAKADEMRTLLSAADSKAGWDQARPPGGGGGGASPALVAEDADVANVVARAYEEALGDSAPLRGAAPELEPATSARLRALAARDAILDHASQVAPTARVRPPSLADAPGLTGAQRNLARSAQAIFRNDAPRTFAGQAMHDQVLMEMRRSPGFRQTVVAQAPAAQARLRAGFGISPRSPPGQRLWSELSLTTLDAAVERVAGPDVADMVGEISRTTLKNYETAQRYEFMRNLAGGDKGLQSALDRLAAGKGKVTLPDTGRDYLRQINTRSVGGGETVRAVAPYEPSIEVPFERGVNLERAGSIIMEQSARGEAANTAYRARVFSEALENYSGTFPSQPGIERVTPRGQILEAIASNDAAVAKGAALKGRVASIEAGKLSEWSAGRKFSTTASLVKNGRIELPRTALPSNAVNSVERRRSFLQLHSSPKVGGVLIGRKPEAGSQAAAPFHPSALRWEVGAGDVRLILAGPDGAERRSRLFRRDLTELALAYTADGRPTAVTIVNLQPLYDRKVLLHPALVDTAAGKAIARTDMIVFHLIEHEPWYVDAYLAVLNQVELYRRAWAIRQSVLGPLDVLKPEYVTEVERHFNEGAVAVRHADPAGADRGEERSALKFMTAATDKDGVVAALTQTARDPDAISDPSRSPLMLKTAYFDAELIADMLAAGGRGRSLDDFDTAVRMAATRRLGDLPDWIKSRDKLKSPAGQDQGVQGPHGEARHRQ